MNQSAAKIVKIWKVEQRAAKDLCNLGTLFDCLENTRAPRTESSDQLERARKLPVTFSVHGSEFLFVFSKHKCFR